MATRYAVTVDVGAIVGSGIDPAKVRAVVTTTLPQGAVVSDGAGSLLIGDGPVTLNPDGTGTLDLLDPNDPALNVTGWQYHLSLSAPASEPIVSGRGPVRIVHRVGPFAPNASGPIDTWRDQWDTPATTPSWRDGMVTLMDGKVAQAQAAQMGAVTAQAGAETALADAQALVISDLGTTDGQTRALIEAPASQTAQALSATIATETVGKVDAAPMGSVGFALRHVDQGHWFLGFDETGAMISTLAHSTGGRTLGRSTDQGVTWTAVGTPSASQTPAGFWVTAAGTWLCYVNDLKLYRSTNHGTTWTAVATTGGLLNAGLTQQPDGTLWAAEYMGQARIWRSTDDGATWTVYYDFPNADAGDPSPIVRHVHGIKSLPSGLWVYTGDNGTQCGLWRLEGGAFVRKSPALTDAEGAQRWRAVDIAERGGWLYWVQDGASPAGGAPVIVKAHPSDLAGTLKVLATIPTGGWYITTLPDGALLAGSVNEGMGPEVDRATRLWHIDLDDRVSEIWSAPPAPSGLTGDFLAVRNLAVGADGRVLFTVNQVDFTGAGSAAYATIVGNVSAGGRPLAMGRTVAPAAYSDTARVWVARGIVDSPSKTAGAASVVPDMTLTVNTRTTRPIIVALSMDVRNNTAGEYVNVTLQFVNQATGGVTQLGELRRASTTTFSPLSMTEVFMPPAPGDYTIRATWEVSGSSTGYSGWGLRTLTAWQV